MSILTTGASIVKKENNAKKYTGNKELLQYIHLNLEERAIEYFLSN